MTDVSNQSNIRLDLRTFDLILQIICLDIQF